MPLIFDIHCQRFISQAILVEYCFERRVAGVLGTKGFMINRAQLRKVP